MPLELLIMRKIIIYSRRQFQYVINNYNVYCYLILHSLIFYKKPVCGIIIYFLINLRIGKSINYNAIFIIIFLM